MRRESGDHCSTGDRSRPARRLVISWQQPSGIAPYPKSFSPSVVSWVSSPVAASRTHRFSSRAKAIQRPSGEGRSASDGATSAVGPAQV